MQVCSLITMDLIGISTIILWTLFALLLLLKFIASIRTRREILKVYERGNVPQVPIDTENICSVFTGNMIDIIFQPKNLIILNDYHRKLRSKTFGTFYGPHPWTFTCDPELLHRLFVIESNRFVNLNAFHLPFSKELDKSLAQLRDDDWRLMRKALNPSFSGKQLKSDNVDNDIEDMADKLIDCIQDHPMEKIIIAQAGRLKQMDGRVVDILYNAKKYSLGVVSKVAFGSCDGIVNMKANVKDEFIEKLHDSSKILADSYAVYASVMFGSGVQKLMGSLKCFSKLGAYSAYFQRVLCESIAARRTMNSNEIKRNRKFIDTIMESVEKYKLGDDVLKANLFFFLIAGFETTANTMALIIWLLAKHPEKQEKLRQVLMSGNSNDKYVEWCIMESLRLYPAVPTGIGRELSENYHYEGMTFYKGTSIVANFYTMHRLEEYWGPNSNEFEPERFAKPFKHHAQYMAFGAGSRHCIGYNLAIMEIRTLLNRLLTKYRIETCSKTPSEIDFTSPNLIHMIIDGQIDLAFVEIKTV